ncbi:MAG: hypothetical protein EBX39_04145 [Actinobacteria bacterium]|nr:hypothetical protein [Actinomycetota bacterium]
MASSDPNLHEPVSDPEPVDEPEDAQPLTFGSRTARVLAVAVMLCIAALWSYTLWGPTKKTPPGLLADASWAVQAQSTCTRAAAVIDALPAAFTAPDARSRAEVIAQANDALRTMLDDLAASAPPAGASNDGRMIGEWLADWRTYLGDRDRYVDALDADPDARFYVTEKVKGQQITKPIDFFATYNDMPNCVTPGDLG